MALYEAWTVVLGGPLPALFFIWAFTKEIHHLPSSSSSTFAKCITSAWYADKLSQPSCRVLSSRISQGCVKVAPQLWAFVSCCNGVIERDGFLSLGEAVVCFPEEQLGSPPSLCFAACQAFSLACSWHLCHGAAELHLSICLTPQTPFHPPTRGPRARGGILQTNDGKPVCGGCTSL